MATINLRNAKTSKKDEFYTQLSDIEKELKFYTKHFENKIILCNCDDPRVSNFTRFFLLNFKRLKLKKLICTCYKNNNIDLFTENIIEQAVYFEYEGNDDVDFNLDNIQLHTFPLNGNGDFRSEECINLLKEADIVCSNPPFSLFREYLNQLISYNKEFIIIGNVNAITYKDTFPLIKENKLWLGATNFNTGMYFRVPSTFVYAATYKFEREKNGEKVNRVPGVCWFTNLDIDKRHEDLILYKKYNKNDYPKYDNYEAINVNKTTDIPCDYPGVMGVPITFLDKYNPEQFEIIGNEYSLNIKKGRGYINGKRIYSRIFIKNIKL